ncbi:MAG: hypothetical protein U0350_20145 [Caldilineaceae bacterium]
MRKFFSVVFAFVLLVAVCLPTAVFSQEQAQDQDASDANLLSNHTYLPLVQTDNMATANAENVAAAQETERQISKPQISTLTQASTLGPLSALKNLQAEQSTGAPRIKPLFQLPESTIAAPDTPDPVVQTTAGPLVGTTNLLNFAGVGLGDYGFIPNAAPPDTNLAVGDTQVVQWVNSSFAIFNKATGAKILGPLAGNALWSGLGNGCATNNDGDPVVRFDRIAHRWIFTQFSVSTTPFLQCFAISTSADATGSYFRYYATYANFNDYPKLGVWPDGYYITYNMFNPSGTSFLGARVCALERSKMLVGALATQVCFQLSTSYDSLLPSDLNGALAPPAGAPNFLLNFGTNALRLWKFHVVFGGAGSTLTGPTTLPVAAFTRACSGGACIPQPGTTTKLDSLADRLMFRLAYRRFADGHEALVVNHAVKPSNGTSAIRWYEVRNPNGTPVVFQQGTFAPDTSSRWMGSIAMDKQGNIAVGYSVSSSTLKPSIRYTGRLAGDALGTLQAENIIIAGGGSQTGGLTRWGDYSTMDVDPSNDCTFWYTNEYLKANGSFNWSTRIAAFKFPSCQ